MFSIPRALLACVATFAIELGTAHAAPPATVPTASPLELNAKDQAFFKQRINDLVLNGFRRMDMATVKSFYHPDAATRFADADGPFHKGWPEYSAWLGKIFHKLAVKQKFELRDTYSYKAGRDAVITTTIIDNRTRLSNGQDIDSAMRLSLVWGKKDQQWLVIHEHFSLWHGELATPLGYLDTGRKQQHLD